MSLNRSGVETLATGTSLRILKEFNLLPLGPDPGRVISLLILEVNLLAIVVLLLLREWLPFEFVEDILRKFGMSTLLLLASVGERGYWFIIIIVLLTFEVMFIVIRGILRVNQDYGVVLGQGTNMSSSPASPCPRRHLRLVIVRIQKEGSVFTR